MHKALLVTGWLAVSLPAQVNIWPAALQKPPARVPADSSGLLLTGDQRFYRTTLDSRDSLTVHLDDSVNRLHQKASYRLSRDALIGIDNHFVDLSGSYQHVGGGTRLFDPGFKWAPLLVVDNQENSRSLETLVDAGPTLAVHPWGVPVEFQGGGSGRLWDPDLKRRERHSHVGGFAGVSMQGERGLGDLPVYLRSRAFTRRIDTSNVGSLSGSVLAGYDISTGDSLLVYVSDSLLDGRSAFQGDSRQGGRYLNVPRRMVNSLHVLAALKGARRLGFTPAATYSFSRRTLRYLRDGSHLSDRRNTENAANLYLLSDTTRMVSLRSGIRFGFERDDRLYTMSVDEVLREDKSNTDTLRVNQKDYQGYKVRTDNRLELRLPGGTAAAYSLLLSRYSRRYPFVYFTDEEYRDSVTSTDDDHWLEQQHRLDLTLVDRGAWQLGAEAEITRNHLINLDAARSINNAVSRFYRLGISTSCSLSTGFRVRHDLRGDVARTEYDFKEENHYNFPPYSRTFSSKLDLEFVPWGPLRLRSVWTETYLDDGYRFSSAYIDPALTNDSSLITRGSFYAIERESRIHELRLESFVALPRNVEFGMGGYLQNSRHLQWDGSERGFVRRDRDTEYRLIPFVELTFLGRTGILLTARAARSYTGSAVWFRRWHRGVAPAEAFWDLKLTARAGIPL